MSYRIKGTPWTYKGSIDVSDCKTSQEVMEKAALDWNVAKCPLFAEMPIVTDDRIDESLDRLSEQLKRNEGHTHGNNIYKLCDSNFGIYRTDCNYPLGIVKGKYTPVQNIDALMMPLVKMKLFSKLLVSLVQEKEFLYPLNCLILLKFMEIK